jgi:stage II sporulation protein R
MFKKMLALFCASFILLSTVDVFVPRGEAQIYESVIRLHVIAEDDSETAQSIKLLVRDAILNECSGLFSENGDVIAASETVEENLPLVESVANRVLSENNAGYEAKAEFGLETYPTRVYEDFKLPSGEYLSLRVKLGKAEGQNWWCVLFPPLCSKASSKKLGLSNTKVGKNDSSVFTNRKYVFRFKFLEIFG